MAQKAPEPAQPTAAARARNYLLIGFLVSIVLHAILGHYVQFNNTVTAQEKVQKVKIERIPTPPPTPPPTPTPKPTPPPTPPPKQTPPPQQTPAPQQPKIKINTLKSQSKNNGPSESANKYTTGNTQGVPQGQGTAAPASAPPATPVPATPTPKPTPTPAQCAHPNLDATTVRAAEADEPPMAQQQGITGDVQVEVQLDSASHIVSTRIHSSPSALLNNAALSAARQSTFQTEVRNCQPQAATYLFTVSFSSQ